jgi:hypothetical protein
MQYTDLVQRVQIDKIRPLLKFWLNRRHCRPGRACNLDIWHKMHLYLAITPQLALI